jgi:hypothetical protein
MQATSTVSCPECCTVDTAWQVVGVTGSSLNPGATCTLTPNLTTSGGCVTGSIEDAVLASVSGTYTVTCQNPLIGDNGQPFENPCQSKEIEFPGGELSLVIDECTATCTIEIEDCPEFEEATADRDYALVISLVKCAGGNCP